MKKKDLKKLGYTGFVGAADPPFVPPPTTTFVSVVQATIGGTAQLNGVADVDRNQYQVGDLVSFNSDDGNYPNVSATILGFSAIVGGVITDAPYTVLGGAGTLTFVSRP